MKRFNAVTEEAVKKFKTLQAFNSSNDLLIAQGSMKDVNSMESPLNVHPSTIDVDATQAEATGADATGNDDGGEDATD
jgi:hypothetical protein